MRCAVVPWYVTLFNTALLRLVGRRRTDLLPAGLPGGSIDQRLGPQACHL